MDFDYKKYSLERLENWIHDAISCSEASPQEIYDVIKNVVSENYYIYKNHTERCYELLALLNGNGNSIFESIFEIDKSLDDIDATPRVCNKDDKSPECQKAWNDFWEENYYPEECKKSKEPSVEDIMPPWGHSDMEALRYTEEELNAMCDAAEKKDKVTKWQLPVEEVKIDETDETEYFITLPDDLLEAAGLKENDQVEWIDQGDGSYLLKKIKEMTYDEAIAAGWTMTADGFWIKDQGSDD